MLLEASGVVTPITCICAIITLPDEEALNPPDGLAILAALEQAATTDGSSHTMGTITSLPLIVKLSATPIGRANFPMTFSIIWSALSRSRESAEVKISFSSSVRDANSATSSNLFSIGNLKNPE